MLHIILHKLNLLLIKNHEKLLQHVNETYKLLKNTTVQQANFCYRQGKWNVKKVIGHIQIQNVYPVVKKQNFLGTIKTNL